MREELPGCTKSDCPTCSWLASNVYGAGQLARSSIPTCSTGAVRANYRSAARRCGTPICASRRCGPVRETRAQGSAGGGQFHHWAARPSCHCPPGGARVAGIAQDDHRLLPLNPRARILVAGTRPDIGVQCGGWTSTGRAITTPMPIFRTTSIFGGIKAAVEAAGGTASFSRMAASSSGPRRHCGLWRDSIRGVRGRSGNAGILPG